MNVAGVTSEITFTGISRRAFSRDYASLGTFFLLFVPAGSRVLSDNRFILLLVNRAELPVRLKATGTGAFQLKTGNGGDFPR